MLEQSKDPLQLVELKTFVPAKDFKLSQQFYCDLGFTMASEGGGVAYFYRENCSFLLQDFYQKAFNENFVMHLLVTDIYAWHQRLKTLDLQASYGTSISEVVEQPWAMLDFTLSDPSGVLWRIGQNIE